MKHRICGLLSVAASLAAGVPAGAAPHPAIKTSDQNKVPACATPGRLIAFLQSRNSGLDERFVDIAGLYMRHGEALRIRWDYAFFQMLLETGNLSFQRGNGKPGDVKPKQNNFAGLGATGRGEPGESFADVSTGVKAHLQHLLMYSGEVVEDPVAERTRKVQEWGILNSWHKSLKAPVTFADLARKWAPGENSYARDIDAIATRFYGDYCNRPDPRPELLASAREGGLGAGDRGTAVTAGLADTKTPAPGASRVQADVAPLPPAHGSRSAAVSAPAKAAGLPPLTKNAGEGTSTPEQTDRPGAQSAVAASQTASIAPLAPSKPAAPVKGVKCRVWTASYGGQKAIIIRATADQFVNYTVLDVNEGAEKRETEAYIAAYARGGETIGTFPSQTQALDKAFELCPDG